MEGVKDTTARLRRTFQYPTDDSSHYEPEAMDEEEQESLIQSLADENATRNAQFRLLLLAVPILSTIPYLPALVRASTFRIALLGLTSLSSTAWLVHRLQPSQTGIPQLDAWLKPATPPAQPPVFDDEDDNYGARQPSEAFPSARARRRRSRSSSFSFATRKSPLEQYLPYLNTALCIVLFLMITLETSWNSQISWSRMLLGYLPGAVYTVVLVAKAVMAGVDPEVELASLKYEYKGA